MFRAASSLPLRLGYERLKEISDNARRQIPSLQKAYRFLRIKPQPFDIRQPSSEVRHAITALCVLLEDLTGNSQLHATGDSAYHYFEKRWSTHTWPWIEFLVDYFLTVTDNELAHDVLDLQDKAIWCIPVMISAYYYGSSQIMSLRLRWVQDRMKKSPEVFSTTVKLWVCCLERGHPILPLLLVTLQMYRGSVNRFTFQDAIVHEVISIPNSTRILLNYAVHEATLQVAKDEADLSSLEFTTIVIGLMALSDSHFDKFLTHSLSNRGISSLTFILKTLSSDNDFKGLCSEHKISRFRCARRLLVSIQQMIFGQRQQSTVILVLQGGLLHSMVHSTAMFEFELGISHKDTYGPPMTDMYCAVWKELVRTAKVVKAIRHRYKTEYEMGFRHICVNPKCPHILDNNFDVSPKKCTGCLVAVYCSRSCQKQNWKEHRSTCKEERRLAKSTGLPPAVTALDRDFFRWLCVTEVCTRSNEIEDLSEGVDEPIAVLDFQGIPPTIDVVSLSELKSPETPYPITEGILNLLRESIDQGFDVSVYALFGGDLRFAKGVDLYKGRSDNDSDDDDDDDEGEEEEEERDIDVDTEESLQSSDKRSRLVTEH
ncbi:hypothetical protein VKT23_004816 [Stygiomarasmius scandens]|uniref:MYND-type domain-containing protein n=1 Tax=Marasmiellus scandens TaxID=2682957 RepID=A0ABR1JS72_9AGAR